MSEIVEVIYKVNRRGYYDNYLALPVKIGDCIVVEDQRGVEVGLVHSKGVIARIRQERWKLPAGKVLRIANEDDLNRFKARTAREEEAMSICQEKIKAHNLDMDLVDVEYFNSDNKVCFFFSSSERVDFRQLVKDLAAIFKMRIELKQIGVRDKAKIHGGYGRCGRTMCCSSFLNEFEPVTLRAAKDQDLSLNPANISGCCGRLMCCLMYERDFYLSCKDSFPAIGKAVVTRKGKEKVKSVDFFSGKVELIMENGSTREIFINDLKREMKEEK